MIRTGVGFENFRELIELKRTYVDKTNFIIKFLTSDYPKVSLFTRPRRFGKTLTLSMLAEFFPALHFTILQNHFGLFN